MDSVSHPDLQIAQTIDETYDDPLDFVLLAYPWGEPGELAGFSGPDGWQRAFLEDLGNDVLYQRFQHGGSYANVVQTSQKKCPPPVTRSPEPLNVPSNSYRALLLVAGPLGGFEPRRPRHSFLFIFKHFSRSRLPRANIC